ncbi:hypothetical protein D3C86_2076810 [compost metagenome]
MNLPHNIAGSEAFRTGPAVIVRQLPRRRPRLSPVAWLFLSAAAAAPIAALVDMMIGQPVCLTIATVAFLVVLLRG